jgi:cytochrome c553
MPKDQIIARVNAFRGDERQAAAMHRVAKQYDEQQLREVAAYLARQPATR